MFLLNTHMGLCVLIHLTLSAFSLCFLIHYNARSCASVCQALVKSRLAYFSYYALQARVKRLICHRRE